MLKIQSSILPRTLAPARSLTPPTNSLVMADTPLCSGCHKAGKLCCARCYAAGVEAFYCSEEHQKAVSPSRCLVSFSPAPLDALELH